MDRLSSVNLLPGIGPKRAIAYNAAGITTIGGLLEYYPRDYINLNLRYAISECPYEENVCVRAMLTKKIPAVRLKNKLNITKAVIEDDTGKADVSVFNIPGFFDRFKIGEHYIFYGRAKTFGGRLGISNPRVFDPDTTGLIPVYPSVSGVSQDRIIENIKTAILRINLTDFIDGLSLEEYGLVSLADALKNIHFPVDATSNEAAKRRLAFNEVYSYRKKLAEIKAELKSVQSLKMSKKSAAMEEYYDELPFEMTASQKKAISEIIDDMTDDSPMNRMLCGDVGSGKTAVAAAACVLTYANGYQSAFMAPTEILARQHYSTLEKLLSPLGIKTACVIGALSAKEHREILEKISSGEIDVAIGTHALIADKAEFKNLALVITDEQHRFGVRQREKLAKKGDNPHRLIMSATPIPRTMAMMLYGDLDISNLTDMPLGRKPIETFAVTDKLRDRAYNFIKEQIKSGRQAYIVCARIDDNEDDYSSVESYAENLRANAFSGYNIGTLHGRLSPEESAEIMGGFISGDTQILVSTTVIEVGVDVPNATVILIEDAELFGLSQLHQLRGRVGRSIYQSYCILMTANPTAEVRERLKYLSETSSGVDIAMYDLERRGAGDFLGIRQSGFNQFRFASYITLELLKDVDNYIEKTIDK
ncbi:MAG: ATP-dependent DNA helicase RecG [Ruminococcus sp.]|jgi:ATP-dependent DNA helicase RecG|nr:ATP-dependent DNA helicase RecG [Ruminococcus sp.]